VSHTLRSSPWTPSVTFELPDYKPGQVRLPPIDQFCQRPRAWGGPNMRADVGAANSYNGEADEDIMTPVRPSENALGRPPDAEPDEEDLCTSLTGVPLLSF